jgi:hypothetical protein
VGCEMTRLGSKDFRGPFQTWLIMAVPSIHLATSKRMAELFGSLSNFVLSCKMWSCSLRRRVACSVSIRDRTEIVSVHFAEIK